MKILSAPKRIVGNVIDSDGPGVVPPYLQNYYGIAHFPSSQDRPEVAEAGAATMSWVRSGIRNWFA